MDELRIPPFHPLANLALRLAYSALLDLEVQGMQYALGKGSVLLVINHTHFLDPLIPCALYRPDVFPMAKAEVFEGRWRWMFRAYGSFPVRRGDADMQALKQAFRVLRGGHVMLMAPEGTRAKEGGLQKAHEGVGLIAARSGAPVQPIAVWGGRSFVPNLKKLRRTPVHVRIGQPMLAHVTDRKPTREEISAITREIMYSIAVMLPPEYRGAYADVEGFAPRYLLPYHAEVPPQDKLRKGVMPLTN